LIRTRNYTLLELLVNKTHLRWYIAVGISALLLLLGLVITAIAIDTPFNRLGWNFWRTGIQGPAIIIYILAIYPPMTKIGEKAIESILPWVDMNREELDKFDLKYRVPNRLGEWISLCVGVIFILILSQPWEGNFEFNTLFLFITELIMFGLLGLLIYYGFRNARYITLINKNLKLDLFNLNALAPIARWSLSISLAFIGGIVISIVFQTIDNLIQWQIILIYIILIVSTVVMFFTSLWSTHMTIVNVKRHELNLVEDKLARACRRLAQNAHENNSMDNSNSSLHNEVAAWALYERRIRETKEWPYNAGIIGQLIISIVSSGIIYVIKLFSGNFSGL
jgi:hypothetical protein